jgi:hypothetical protein
MKRYKISESKLNEFWGWFGKKKPQTLQQVIDNDPVLNKLDDELYDINRSYIPKLQKVKDTQPEMWKQLVKYNMVDPKDFK